MIFGKQREICLANRPSVSFHIWMMEVERNERERERGERERERDLLGFKLCFVNLIWYGVDWFFPMVGNGFWCM